MRSTAGGATARGQERGKSVAERVPGQGRPVIPDSRRKLVAPFTRPCQAASRFLPL
jgi:hypothetical protein